MTCLVVHVHLLQDWECKAEYTRTLSVALLCWQPMYSSLPGCCFVEESCEAMLSRMVGRCRANHQLSSYEDVLRLFVTLPPPGPNPQATRGTLQQSLVYLFTQRVQRILANPQVQPFAAVQSAREAVWEQQCPAGFQFPAPIQQAVDTDLIEQVLRGAMVSLTGRGVVTDELRAVAYATVKSVTVQREKASRQGALDRVGGWGRERRQRAARPSGDSGRVAGNVIDQTAVLGMTFHPELPTAGGLQQPGELSVVTVAENSPGAAVGVAVSSPTTSELGSLFEPPPTDEAASAGYETFGDTDSLGSAGELLGDRDGQWGTLEDEGLFDYLGEAAP